MSILGAKIVISAAIKQPFRPKIDIIEDFDALKCNFLSFFSRIALMVRTLTKYFGYIQVKISYGTKKPLIFGVKTSIFGPFSQCLENVL